ncbi:MAG: alpha/beta fold hydrolase [Phycisphaera sp. RhM]|nr:alpha/beta fold hydrolase [Phycisphaera sp. RhM]
MSNETIGNDSNLRFGLEHFPWLDPFVPHRWWRGGWLQTLSIKAVRTDLDTNQWPGTVQFDIVGDQTPPDVLSGYYLPPKVSGPDRPLVVIIHGMGGHARSGYMLSMAERLLEAGFPVVLWNNRGAGDSAQSCRRFHHPGFTDDLSDLCEYLRTDRASWCEHGLAAVAFSLGGNVLLRYLAETGGESDLSIAASISTPLDMHTTSQNLRRGANRLFDRYLLHRQQKELLRDGSDLSDEERQVIQSARSVWDLDDRFTAPRFDYENAEEFYRENSAIYVLDEISIPTLLFHAMDDPVVDDDVFRDRDWSAEGPLYPALAESGGHTGFLDRDGQRWHERAIVNFFTQVDH